MACDVPSCSKLISKISILILNAKITTLLLSRQYPFFPCLLVPALPDRDRQAGGRDDCFPTPSLQFFKMLDDAENSGDLAASFELFLSGIL